MTEMFGEAWPPMSVPDLAPDDDDDSGGFCSLLTPSRLFHCFVFYLFFFYSPLLPCFMTLEDLSCFHLSILSAYLVKKENNLKK